MKAQVLAEIGSWIAVHSAALIFGNETDPPEVVNRYWGASRCRLNRWSTALKLFENDLEADTGHDPWPAIEIVIQEIIVSELTTRVFAAALVTHDWNKNSDELHGVAHGIHIGHIEARNRALRVMLKGRNENEAVFDRLNHLRRRIERWTDLFLAQLPVCERAKAFAFDESRVEDFRLENRQSPVDMTMRRQQVFSASLAADLNSLGNRFPANPELNRDIASGILACFPADRFDSFGMPRTIRQVWLEQSQADTSVLIDQLTDLETKGVSTRNIS